jgi:hypothetical protein
MSVHLQVVNFDEEFKKLRNKPIIINDFKTTSIDDKNFIKDMIYTKYDGDIMSSTPRCNCPASANPIIGADREGEFCPKCSSVVKGRFDDEMESILWVRAPKGVAPFINPHVRQAIKGSLFSRRVNILQWLTNTSYTVKYNSSRPELLDRLESLGIQRGYNNFVYNFEDYLDRIMELKDFKRKNTVIELRKFLANNKNNLFCEHLPLPNRALFVIEPTSVEKTYMDLIGIAAIDAIAMMTSIDVEGQMIAQHARENRTSRYLELMGTYQESYLRQNIAKKTGSFRKHNVSSRVGPSFRAVITSITGEHDFEQISIPWAIAMVIFRPLMENIFLKNGLTANEILEIFTKYANRYDERLYKLMMKIMYDFTDKGFPTLWNRNPTLGRSSILMVFIGDIKKNVNDPTVSMSIGLVVFFNA